MAKKFFKVSKHQTGRSITTKTPYGSTSDMIVSDTEILKKITVADHCVLLKDDDGYYITNKTMIDSGLADPMRHCEKYRSIIGEKIALDIANYDNHHKTEEETNEQNNLA
jgi:hypothetical protein